MLSTHDQIMLSHALNKPLQWDDAAESPEIVLLRAFRVARNPEWIVSTYALALDGSDVEVNPKSDAAVRFSSLGLLKRANPINDDVYLNAVRCLIAASLRVGIDSRCKLDRSSYTTIRKILRVAAVIAGERNWNLRHDELPLVTGDWYPVPLPSPAISAA